MTTANHRIGIGLGIGLLIGFSAIGIFYYSSKSTKALESEEPLLNDKPFMLRETPARNSAMPSIQEGPVQNPVVVETSSDVTQSLSAAYSASSSSYFKKLISAPGPLTLYKKSLKLFPKGSKAGENASVWLTMGLVINDSSKEFAEVFWSSLQEARNDSKMILENFTKNKSVIHSDPFLLQMSNNLVPRLDLSAAEINSYLSNGFFECIFEPGCLETERYRVHETGLTFLTHQPDTTDQLVKNAKRMLEVEALTWRKKMELFYVISNYYPQIPLEVTQ